MKLNLKNVLSRNAYKFVEDYCENGVDALALMHPENGAKIRDVVNTFQALADPKYVNIRKDWGNAMSSAPFEALSSAVNYVDGKKNTNAFALKFRANEGFGLRFPLLNSYYDSNSKFKNYGCAEIGSILSKLQSSLNFRLEISDDAKEYVSVKEGVMRSVTSKLSHPIRMIRAKEIEDEFDPSHKGIGLKKTKLTLDETYNGQKLTSVEQMIAIVDFYNARVVKKTAKLYKLNKNIDKSKILLASQILSDMVVCWGLNFGPENGREIDNALRLQLSNVIASLTQDKSLSIISEIACFSAIVMTQKLGIDIANIVANRKQMGVEYLNQIECFNDVVFGPTKNAMFRKEGEDVYYFGDSPALLKVLNSKMYKGETYNPPKAEAEAEPSVVFGTPELEMMDPLEEQAEGPLYTESQATAPEVIVLGAVAEEEQEEVSEKEEKSSELQEILSEARSEGDEFAAFFGEDEAKDEEMKFEENMALFPEDKPEAIFIQEGEELEIGEAKDEDYDEDFRKLSEKFGFVIVEKETLKNKFSKLGESIKNAVTLKKTVAEKTEKVEEQPIIEDEHVRWVFPTKDIERIMKETTPATNWEPKTFEDEDEIFSDTGYESLKNEEGKEYLLLNHFEFDGDEKPFEPMYMISTEDGLMGITQSGEVRHNLSFAEDLDKGAEETNMIETTNQEQQTLSGTWVRDVKNELDTVQTALVASDNHKVKRETEEIQTTLVGTFIQDPAQTTFALFEEKQEEKKVAKIQEKKINLPKTNLVKSTISLNSEVAKFKFSAKKSASSTLKRNYGMSF